MTYHTTLDQAGSLAASAAPRYRAWSVEQRRDLLHSIAGGLEAARAELVGVAQSETGLSVERLDGEISRTAGQLRLYGDHVAAGKHLSARRSPGAGPGGVDVWTVDVPIGPVAVFAASNFPFAFGVPGGDTASALAAGCPVIVKGHPAQPVLSKRLAEIVGAAVDASGAPEGTFGFVDSDSAEDPKSLSLDLVRHPAVRAVGFTGSLGGGRALMDAAAARPDPIPVYAEMSSVNPVFVLPDAARDEKWAGILAGAVLGSAGQLCTKPGLIFVPAGPAGKVLGDAIEAAVEASDSLTMLTQGMAEGVLGWRGAAVGAAVDATVGAGEAPNEPTRLAKPFAVQIEAGGGRLPAEYVEEHFGPTTVVVHADPAAYAELAEGLDGQLTATIIADDSSDADRAAARALLPTLTGKAGRVVWNNVPTGVAVVEAMQHGGPWPATSAPWSTSVGTEAIKRFVRPVAMQGVPEDLAG